MKEAGRGHGRSEGGKEERGREVAKIDHGRIKMGRDGGIKERDIKGIKWEKGWRDVECSPFNI